MRDAGIFDGDLLVVDRSITPKQGDVVVAVVEEEISVKRLIVENGVPRLVFENRDWPAYLVPDAAQVEIWGVATCPSRLCCRRVAGPRCPSKWVSIPLAITPARPLTLLRKEL